MRNGFGAFADGLHSDATFSRFCMFLPVSARLAPRPANCLAAAAPIPELAPVIRTTLPANCIADTCFEIRCDERRRSETYNGIVLTDRRLFGVIMEQWGYLGNSWLDTVRCLLTGFCPGNAQCSSNYTFWSFNVTDLWQQWFNRNIRMHFNVTTTTHIIYINISVSKRLWWSTTEIAQFNNVAGLLVILTLRLSYLSLETERAKISSYTRIAKPVFTTLL